MTFLEDFDFCQTKLMEDTGKITYQRFLTPNLAGGLCERKKVVKYKNLSFFQYDLKQEKI